MKGFHINCLVQIMILFGCLTTGFSQSEGTYKDTDEFNILLLPVEVFIDSTLAQNGMLNYRKLDLSVREADVKTKKRIWTQNLGLRGDMRYGTFS